MTFSQDKELFEQEHKMQESALLSFSGVEGWDVYNCSLPFEHGGQTYLFGRVEKRADWARSHVRLFKQVAPDQFAAAPGSMVYPLEDPCISRIGGQWVMGGTHVVRSGREIARLYAYFYEGSDPFHLEHFTAGPEYMKDIRLVETEDGIGVFSRPRGEHIFRRHGSESIVGYALISDLAELTADVIENAGVIGNMFAPFEWGGCNQCYALDSGLIGIVGHKSYAKAGDDGLILSVYTNVSFVFDPRARRIINEKIIATRASYPDAPAKRPELIDCAFTSGIAARPDGKFNLYSGLGDTSQGRVVIDDPFLGFGRWKQPKL